MRPIIGSTREFRYRNQVQMPVRYNEDESRVEMGFFGHGTHDMVPTDSCHLLSEPMQETLDRARKFLTSLGRDTAAAVHHVIVRESQANGEQLVVFAAIHNDESLRRALARFHAKQVKTVAFTEQDRVDGPVWGHKVDVLKGDGQLMEEIGGIQFRVSPRSFLQVQTDMASRLYDIVLDYAQIRPEDTVVDAYCGIGTMTLMLAQGAKRAIGIEEIASAVDDAKANAVRNRVTNAEFHRGRVEAWLPQWVQSGARPSTIVFDPPRKGIDGPALRAAIQAKIPRIVYASCNPATLRRDLQILLTNGYEIAAIQPMDMFPQTLSLIHI